LHPDAEASQREAGGGGTGGEEGGETNILTGSALRDPNDDGGAGNGDSDLHERIDRAKNEQERDDEVRDEQWRLFNLQSTTRQKRSGGFLEPVLTANNRSGGRRRPFKLASQGCVAGLVRKHTSQACFACLLRKLASQACFFASLIRELNRSFLILRAETRVFLDPVLTTGNFSGGREETF
jgi:hypothetical protein